MGCVVDVRYQGINEDIEKTASHPYHIPPEVLDEEAKKIELEKLRAIGRQG